MLKVVVFNDDITTMEFVVLVLETIFRQTRDEAYRTVLATHHNGSAVCGTYSPAQAHAKVMAAVDFARRHGYPLRFEVAETDSPAGS